MGFNKDRVLRAPCAMLFTTAATKDRGGSRCYRPPDVASVWQELYYRIDICRITKGEHIEHL